MIFNWAMFIPSTPRPRQYPPGFGERLRLAFEEHLVSADHRDLRFKPQLSGGSPVEQFQKLDMGDVWEDANLLQPLLYAMSSKYLRSRGKGCGHLRKLYVCHMSSLVS